MQEVEYEEVCVVRQEQRVIPEWVEETIQVPIVKEVKVTKMCEEFTGRYVRPQAIPIDHSELRIFINF